MSGLENEGYIATRELANEITAGAPDGYGLNFWRVRSLADPQEVIEQVRESALGGLVLPDGAELGLHDPKGYFPDIDLRADPTTLASVLLQGSSYDLPHDSGQVHEVQLRFQYQNDTQVATQDVLAHTSTIRAAHVPSIARKVVANEYIETGYEGHFIEVLKDPTTEQVMALIAIARGVYEQKLD